MLSVLYYRVISFGKYFEFRNIRPMNDVSCGCLRTSSGSQFCFRKMQGTSWEFGDTLAFQNGLCPVGLLIYSDSHLVRSLFVGS